MIEDLYLVIERGGYWGYPRITKILRNEPELTRPADQVLVRLKIEVPPGILDTPTVKVELKPEHFRIPTPTVTPTLGAR